MTKQTDSGETAAAVYDDTLRRLMELLLVEIQALNEKLTFLLSKG